MTKSDKTKRLASVLAAIALTATACGGSSDANDTAASDSATETTIASAPISEADAETTDSGAADDGGDVESSDGSSDDASSGDAGSDAGSDGDAGSDEGSSSNGSSGGIAVGGASITLGDSILAGTLNPAADTSTARFDGSINFVGAPGSELPGEISMGFNGAYDLNSGSSDVTIDFSEVFAVAAESDPDAAELGLFGDFFEEPIRVITIGDTSYVQWGLITLFAGSDVDGDVWLETPAEDSDDLASGFGGGFGGSSPDEFLAQLRDANAVVEDLGAEDVRGNPTTHYRALVDTAALSETLSAEEMADFQSNFGGAGEDVAFPIDFWVGDDGLLYRYEIDLTDPALLEDTDGLERLTITYEIFDYGQDVGITAPPADQIVSDELLSGFGS